MSNLESSTGTQLAGFQCHDCGEIYAAGASMAPCVDAGHYVGAIPACDLPSVPYGADA